MTGATDLFFGLVLAFIVVVLVIAALTALIEKGVDKAHERDVKKAREWVLPIFDAQAKGVLDWIHRTDHAPEQVKERLAALRDELSMSLSWMSDMLAFKKKGAPLLLMYPENGLPYLLLGISDLMDEVRLSEASVLGHIPYPNKERGMLSETECVALAVCYPGINQLAQYNYCTRMKYEPPPVETDESTKADTPGKGDC